MSFRVSDLVAQGIIQGSSAYATIFYDSQDTAYYVDPNSTSNLYALNVVGGQVSVGNSGVGTDWWKDASGTYMEFYGNSTSTRKLRLQGHNGSGSYAQWFVDGGNQQIYGDVAGIRNFLIDSSSVTLRHNGSDKFWTGSDGVRVQGWAYFQNGGQGLHWPSNNWHIYPKDASDIYVRSGATDASIQFMRNGTPANYIHNAADSAIGFLSTGRSWILRVANDGSTQVYGQLTVGNGTSSDIYMTDTDETTRRIHTNSGRIGFLNTSNNWGAYCDNTGNWFSDFSMRAPIFYDSGDTSYYGDFNSTSRVYHIHADHLSIGQGINTSYRVITNGDYYANGGGNFWAEGRFKQYRGSGTWYNVIDEGNIGSFALQAIYGDSGAHNLNVSGQQANIRFSTGQWVNGPTTGNYSHVISFNMASDNRTVQMYLGDVPGYLWWRPNQNGTWHGWERILTSYNYNSWAPTLTGGGASGTWGISISGTAAGETLATVTNRGNVATGDIYVPASTHFRARYSSNDSYHASLNWYGLQLGNNGDNYIIAGRTATGGALVFYTNNTSNFTTINGTFAAKMHSSGRTSFGGASDNGYQVQVYGSLYSSDWIRVGGSQGLYFESYGGGWHMNESSYVRSYNGKSIHMNGGSVDYVGSLYLESGANNVHLQPNTGSYGSLQVTNSKSGWSGIRFTVSNVNLMANTNESGFHNNSYGWQMRWENGTIYCHKNSYGGGTSATVLDSSNYTSYAPSTTGSGASGTWGINITGSAGSVAWGNVTSKPSNIMYYQGFTLDANTMDSNATGFTYSVNAPTTGPIARFSTGGGYDLWLNAAYAGSGTVFYFRTRNGDAGTNNAWRRILNDGYDPYAANMNQYVRTTDSPTFSNLTTTGQIYINNGDPTIFLQDTNHRSAMVHVNSNVFYILRGNGTNSTSWATFNGYWPMELNLENNNATFGGSVSAPAGNITAGGSVYGSDVYTTGGWFRNHTNTNGIYWSTTGWHLFPVNASDFRIHSGSNTDSALRFETNGTTRGYVYAENDNTIGFLNNSRSWTFRTYSNGNALVYGYLTVNGAGTSSSIFMNDTDNGQREIHCNSDRIGFLTQGGSWGAYLDDGTNWYADGSMRAPIFYDSNDTTYYADFANTGRSMYTAGYLQSDRVIIKGSSGGGQIYPTISYGGVSLYGGDQFTNGAYFTVTGIDYGSSPGAGSAEFVIRSTATSKFALFSYNGSTWTGRYGLFGSTGNVTIGDANTDIGYRLYVIGDIYATGNIIAYSDARVKTNVREIENPLARVLNTRGVMYDRTDNEEKDSVGFIAQELEKEFPELVSTSTDGRKGVKYQNMVAVLIEAMKEQNKAIKEQSKEIQKLKLLINGTSN